MFAIVLAGSERAVCEVDGMCACMLQALAYQWLGRWYEDIDQDYKQAQHCYERAVALDDDDLIASKHAGSLA